MGTIPKVNERNEVVGETTIQEARANNWPRRVVRIFIQDREGRLLLQLRSPNVVNFPNLWEQAAGGHVDFGETNREAANRELFEELGISVLLTELIDVYHITIPGDEQFAAIYSGVLDDPAAIRTDINEVADVAWYEPHAIDHMVATEPTLFTPSFLVTWPEVRVHLTGEVTNVLKGLV